MIVSIHVADEFVENSDHPRRNAATEPWRTFYSFDPMPDLDEWSQDGKVHRVRRGGNQPTCRLGTLGGSWIVGPQKRILKTARTPAIDVHDALTMARIGSPDVWFHRGEAPAIEPVLVLAPAKGPAVQLSMFGGSGPI